MLCVSSPTRSAGRKSIAFISTTHTNTVSASGATKRCRSPCWKMPFAWLSTKSIRSSTIAWRRVGTPALAPRTTHQMNPTPTTPSRIDTASESTFIDQKPPSPTGLVRKVRWCWMYCEGVSSLAADIVVTSVLSDKKRHRKNEHRHDERAEQDAHCRVRVVRQHEPQEEQRQADLRCFGPQRADQDSRCRLRIAQRSQERGRDAGDDAHCASRGRRYRAVPAVQPGRRERHDGGGGELPDEDGANRSAQRAKHGVRSLRALQSGRIIAQGQRSP